MIHEAEAVIKDFITACFLPGANLKEEGKKTNAWWLNE